MLQRQNGRIATSPEATPESDSASSISADQADCLSGLPDQALIERTLEGQTAAYGELVLRYQDRLFHVVRHLLGDSDAARDIVQEAFLQALRRLDSFRQAAAFYTWLYRIATNLAISYGRKQRRVVPLHNGHVTQHAETATQPAPEEKIFSEERVARVRTAIGRLPSDYRSVLVLREMEGCRYEEIAEILDLRLGTVRSRLHRARAQLRDQLQDVHQQQLK